MTYILWVYLQLSSSHNNRKTAEIYIENISFKRMLLSHTCIFNAHPRAHWVSGLKYIGNTVHINYAESSLMLCKWMIRKITRILILYLLDFFFLVILTTLLLSEREATLADAVLLIWDSALFLSSLTLIVDRRSHQSS